MKSFIKALLGKLDEGHNIFITGPAGVGKSYLLNQICNCTDRIIALTSSTGISALNIGGQTIHRYLGLGVQSNPKYAETLARSKKFVFTIRNIRRADIIVIDEISMIRSDTFDLIDAVLKKACRSDRPFGGKKMLFVGDFLQLPPVVKSSEDLPRPWAFQSEAWKNGNIITVQLSKVHRQNDIEFINNLHAIRLGKYDNKVIEYFKQFNTKIPDDTVIKLVPTNDEASKINTLKLEEIKNKLYTYDSVVFGQNERDIERIRKNCIADEHLELKVGCRVVAIANDTKDRFVNGSLGVVTDFSGDFPVVEFDSGEEAVITRHTWQEKDVFDRVIVSLAQIPLKLAYAITQHKCQGMTLDNAYISCNRCFAPGQLYVGLSRVSTPQGLYLNQFQSSSIITDGYALGFYS